MSPPMRGRGLKRIHSPKAGAAPGVAPHAGAWIETVASQVGVTNAKVAPHAGAWIET